MTAQPEPAAKPAPVLIVPQPGSRLEQLVASYEMLKAQAETAGSRFRECTDAIKAEICGACPGVTSFTISGSPHWPPLRLSWSNPWRVDSKRLKKEDPVTWVRYAVRSQDGRWELRVQDGL